MSANEQRGGPERGKHRYRSDGTSCWTRPGIDGPGVWITCVRGKEKQTIGEVFDLFEEIAVELWPVGGDGEAGGGFSDEEDGEDQDEDEGLSIEARLAKGLLSLKKGKKGRRFTNCQTNTKCVIFISCKPPIDPVELVTTHIRNVLKTGVTRSRFMHRLVPCSGTSQATVPEIHSLCRRILPIFFDREPDRKYRYKVELTVRNHTTLSRPTIIQEVARCVPEGHTVDLQNPHVFILVEIFKSICGISVAEDYYVLQKFNVMEIANRKNVEEMFKIDGGRIKGGDTEVTRALEVQSSTA